MSILWKRILLWFAVVVLLSLTTIYVVLTIKYQGVDVLTGEFMKSYTCFDTCLSGEEVQHAQRIINECRNKDCNEIRTMLEENDCEDIKKWYSLNKQKVST